MKYLISIDRLNHNTISTASEPYFDVKDLEVFTLAKSAESRDPETGYHPERIREYSAIVVKELTLRESFLLGTHLDPKVDNAFLEVCREFKKINEKYEEI